jgi:hypothetical protein
MSSKTQELSVQPNILHEFNFLDSQVMTLFYGIAWICQEYLRIIQCRANICSK